MIHASFSLIAMTAPQIGIASRLCRERKVKTTIRLITRTSSLIVGARTLTGPRNGKSETSLICLWMLLPKFVTIRGGVTSQLCWISRASGRKQPPHIPIVERPLLVKADVREDRRDASNRFDNETSERSLSCENLVLFRGRTAAATRRA